jgi:4-amino-4-deoxy-L-arabinose transferase-like glycosyltransferase
MNLPSLFKKPSAYLPVAMSLAALVVVLGHIALFGAAREADEGGAAHTFQLLMAAQVPLVALFAIRWLPREPRLGWSVLALQVGAALAALAPVHYFNL